MITEKLDVALRSKYANIIKTKLVKLYIEKAPNIDRRFYFPSDIELNKSIIYSITFEAGNYTDDGTIGEDFLDYPTLDTATAAYMTLNLVNQDQQLVMQNFPLNALNVQNSVAFPFQRLANRKFWHHVTWNFCFIRFNLLAAGIDPLYAYFQVYYIPLAELDHFVKMEAAR